MIRFFDILLSFIFIILLTPLFIVICFLIKLSSKGPVFFKQRRVGLNGVDFFVNKFRTMKVNSDRGGLLTVGNRDPRVTSIGVYLRKWKLDELPQLFNVLYGNMSLVGPRPEVRKYVDLYTLEQMKVLSIKPGITDWASIIYKDENELLAKASRPEEEYVNKILPDKIKYNLVYINKYGVSEYFKILFLTIRRILSI